MVNKRLQRRIVHYFLSVNCAGRTPDVMFLPNIWRGRLGLSVVSWDYMREL